MTEPGHYASTAYGRAIKALQSGRCLVLITVLRTQGSAPRDAGTRMWVGADDELDTVGGGNLEWQALAHARQILATGQPRREVRRYPLGPSLGQCCGGVVWLAFEHLDQRDLAWCLAVHDALAEDRTVCRHVPLEGGEPQVMPSSGSCSADACQWDETSNAFTETIGLVLADVVVCGAGHIGHALLNVLAELPLRITWLDPRSDCWPPSIPPQVRIVQGDADEVPDLPDNAYWLILTHSHALDLQIIEAVLKHRSFKFLGLIGSRTKKARFVSRLRGRYPAEQVSRIQCPIGLVSTSSKEPAVIAVSVAAQLLALMQA
jgi:xanthine dehydrogenase accessory factor